MVTSLKVFSVLLAGLTMAACQTRESMIAGRANPLPPTALHKDAIVRYAKENLKDPYSIRSAEISDYFSYKALDGVDLDFVCVKYNAKNSFGAYTGVTSAVFNIRRDGKIVTASNETWGGCPQRWHPFPEAENIK